MTPLLGIIPQFVLSLALLEPGYVYAPGTPEGGLRFKIPDGWTHIPPNAPELYVGQDPLLVGWMKQADAQLRAADFRGLSVGFRATMGVRVMPRAILVDKVFLNELRQQAPGVVERKQPGWKVSIIDDRLVQIAEVPCVRLLMEKRGQGFVMKELVYMVPGGNAHSASITFTTSSEDYATYEPVFDATAAATLGVEKPALLVAWWHSSSSLSILAALGFVLIALLGPAVALVRRVRGTKRLAPGTGAGIMSQEEIEERNRQLAGVARFSRRPQKHLGILFQLALLVASTAWLINAQVRKAGVGFPGELWAVAGIAIALVGLKRQMARIRARASSPLLEISPEEIVFRPDASSDEVRRIPTRDVQRLRWEADDRVCLYRTSGGLEVLSLDGLASADLPLVRQELARHVPESAP